MEIVLPQVLQEVQGIVLILLLPYLTGNDKSGIEAIRPDVFAEGKAADHFNGALDHPGAIHQIFLAFWRNEVAIDWFARFWMRGDKDIPQRRVRQ
jgi:hypothetical protein